MLRQVIKMGRNPMPAKAPYLPKGWMENFFQIIKRVRLTKFDTNTVKQYNLTAAGNEAKLVTALRFLKIIDDEGEIDQEKLTPLKMEGESFKNALDLIIHVAYAEVFQTLDLNNANSTDLRNFFTGRYGYSQQQTAAAATLFSYLCELAGIKISEDILSLNQNKIKEHKRKEKTDIPKKNKQVTKSLEPQIRNTEEPLHREVEDGGYVIIIRGKDFTLNRTIKTKEDLDLIIKTLEINCRFKN